MGAVKKEIIASVDKKIFKPEWIGLTEDEISKGQAEGEARSFRSCVRWVESKLKEKNYD